MKFSILIPAYKDLYLKECLDSILAQTYTNFELIIANDCSPYNIESIVNQYTDSRIIYYKNEKRYGAVDLVKNWNNCLNHATGDYVICMGDDDRLLPNCLLDYVKLIEKYPKLDLYHMRTQIIDEDSNIITLQEDRPDRESVYSMIWHFWNKRRQYMGDWLFRTTSLKQSGGFFDAPCAWSSDNITAFIAAKETGVANTHEFGFQYRNSRHTISMSNYAFDKVEAWLIVKKWYDSFLTFCPKNDMDKLYRYLLINNLDNYIRHQIYDVEITSDLVEHPFHILKWLREKNKIGIPTKILLGLYYTTFKLKLP